MSVHIFAKKSYISCSVGQLEAQVGFLSYFIILLGASRVRDLPPEKFCSHKFVLGKASEAGFGNEMYKILTAAALSIMLDRSLIIGQTRHIGSLSSLYICNLYISFT